MEGHIRVNGIMVPILRELLLQKVLELSKESILVISYDCEIDPECQRYCDSHEIKILRMN